MWPALHLCFLQLTLVASLVPCCQQVVPAISDRNARGSPRAAPQASELACIGERFPVLILVMPPEAAPFHAGLAHLSLPVRPAHHVHRIRQHDPATPCLLA